MESRKSVFETLVKVNCNEHTEQRNGLTYLSWAWAWQIAKSFFPDANYSIYENKDGWNYFTDGKTCWVKTGVTIEGQEHIEYLPVMDYKNNSIPYERVTSFDVNKAIQRSLTKALARHGLGLYIYAGEDLPEVNEEKTDLAPAPAPKKATKPKYELEQYTPVDEETYWKLVESFARGQLCKSGMTCEEYWKKKTHPTPEAIIKWNHDVQMVKDAQGLE